MILTRLERLKRDLEVGSRELRLSLIERLEEIFNLASDLAGGRVETQTEGGVRARVSLAERWRWTRVAAHTAKMIAGLSESLDERALNEQLMELEALIREAAGRSGLQVTEA
jgi:hypothetical protein